MLPQLISTNLTRYLSVFLFLPGIALAYVSPGNPVGFVNDFAQVLSTDEVARLENNLKSFAEETGNELVVVTLTSLEGDTIENFAFRLFEEWGIGDEAKDNGLLILLSLEERQVRIEVGYGLEPYITDIESSYIISGTLLPNFREGRYADGLTKALDEVRISLSTEMVPSESSNTNKNFLNGDLWYLFVFAITFLASIFGRSKSWWAGGVVGAVLGVIIGLIKGFVFSGLLAILLLVPLGLLFDFLVSKNQGKSGSGGPWFWGGGGRGGLGGGFGGFGGGMSGGGGASGRW